MSCNSNAARVITMDMTGRFCVLLNSPCEEPIGNIDVKGNLHMVIRRLYATAGGLRHILQSA